MLVIHRESSPAHPACNSLGPPPGLKQNRLDMRAFLFFTFIESLCSVVPRGGTSLGGGGRQGLSVFAQTLDGAYMGSVISRAIFLNFAVGTFHSGAVRPRSWWLQWDVPCSRLTVILASEG